ncbi:adenine nucleotide translocase lysine N-methyltransferase isoform X2 [Xenopus laevis]|uniref:Adenine nucleotide translocase lysine N-methyltransferase isoform X2 n=1 Tax=Xenopus laevis TaxID=8355 RepID=A0A8J0VM14_XENLA|nr:adenine nucleotide translocase lysine N-methyltransferase isoform X2 [Xenopus laevis]
MEDNIDTILLNKTTTFLYNDKPSSWLPSLVTACTVSTYAFWAMFVFPGFRKVPVKLRVPFLPSSKCQTTNVLKLLKGREGKFVDLGSGDGRLVFTAVSLGLQCTGYELNPVLLNWAKTLARWRGLSPTQATFLKQNFWEMETLEKKLLAELSEGARVIVCRFPFPHWPPTCTEGVGLNQVWAYDVMHLNGSLLHYRKLQPCT